MYRVVVLFSVFAFTFGSVSAQESRQPSNSTDIVLGYALPGTCGIRDFYGAGDMILGVVRRVFSPDGMLLWTSHGNFEVSIGEPSWISIGRTFSQDRSLLVVDGDGVYDVATGERRFAIDGSHPTFSPDGMLLAASGDGVYEVATGVRRFGIAGFSPEFNADGSLLVVDIDGVYEVATGVRRFEITGYPSVFNADETMLAVGADGVYEVSTGIRQFAMDGYVSRMAGGFSPNEHLLVSIWDGIYDVATGERIFALAVKAEVNHDGSLIAIEDDGLYDVATRSRRFALPESLGFEYEPEFSPDGTVLAIPGHGVYDVATGERRMTITGFGFRYSPDGSLIAIGNAGLYEVATSQRRFVIGAYPVFSSDGTLLAAGFEGVYDVATGILRFPFKESSRWDFSPDGMLMAATFEQWGGACMLFGPADYVWPYRSGLVASDGAITIRSAPAADSMPIAEAFEGELIVFSRTADGQWLKVSAGDDDPAWVSAAAVTITSMPDGVPVER